MKRTFLFFTFFLMCRIAQADIILLKNGQIVEGKVTQVRGIFIRVQTEYGQPFREFLIENVAHIEQTDPDEVSHLAIRNIHQRAINRIQDQQLQEAANKRAAALIEEAIQKSEASSLNGAPARVKAVVQEKASAIIGEAVKKVDTPELINVSTEIKSIAQEKATGVIEQAVKEVEVLPLQRAPEGVQKAAKKAASTLIEGAVTDVETQTQLQAQKRSGLISSWVSMINFENWRSVISNFDLTIKDGIIAGLLVLMLLILLREKERNRIDLVGTRKEAALASTLKELDEELEQYDRDLTQRKSGRPVESWTEKRKFTRVKRELPISLILDKVKPISAMVKNISLGGAFAICNDIKLLKLGDHVEFRCDLEDMNAHFGINGKAEVVRIKSNRGLGLKFVDLDENSINYLLKF